MRYNQVWRRHGHHQRSPFSLLYKMIQVPMFEKVMTYLGTKYSNLHLLSPNHFSVSLIKVEWGNLRQVSTSETVLCVSYTKTSTQTELYSTSRESRHTPSISLLTPCFLYRTPSLPQAVYCWHCSRENIASQNAHLFPQSRLLCPLPGLRSHCFIIQQTRAVSGGRMQHREI